MTNPRILCVLGSSARYAMTPSRKTTRRKHQNNKETTSRSLRHPPLIARHWAAVRSQQAALPKTFRDCDFVNTPASRFCRLSLSRDFNLSVTVRSIATLLRALHFNCYLFVLLPPVHFSRISRNLEEEILETLHPWNIRFISGDILHESIFTQFPRSVQLRALW